MDFTKIIIKNNVRIFVSDYTNTAKKAINLQSRFPLPSLILATAIAVLGPLAFMTQKNHGKTIATIKGNGPIKMLVVESRNNGDIRALLANDQIETEFDAGDFNNIPLILGLGQSGTLKIIHQYNGQQFGGEVILANADLITDLAYYFELSDQVKTAVRAGVIFRDKNTVSRAYSAIFQLLPNATEIDIQWITNFIKNYDLATIALETYIEAINGVILKTKQAQWKCNCSRTNSLAVANLLSAKEIAEILEQHNKVEVLCHFCKKAYVFQVEDFETKLGGKNAARKNY